MVTCGILAALGEMGKKTVSFNAGRIILTRCFTGKQSEPMPGIGSFLTSASALRSLLARHAKDADLAVIEGVMGYYDGSEGQRQKPAHMNCAASQELLQS